MTPGSAPRPPNRPDAPPRRLRICFVAHNALGALKGVASEHSGGIERQSSLWARWFAARGHETALVTWDPGSIDPPTVNGVRVVKLCRRESGIPGLRFFYPRWSSLVRALRQAEADVYHYMSGDSGLGQIALWCRARGRSLTYYVSSSWAAERELPYLGERRERILYRMGLRRAQRVMVQTRGQQAMLSEHFGIESIVVPMPCQHAADHAAAAPRALPAPGSRRVIWVGRLSWEKRLEWLLDVAQACPDLAFDVVGAANEEDAYSASLLGRAKGLPNVVLHGRVSDDAKLSGLYEGAALLCCTSSSEGFPNTFLEAWSHGLPIVTSFDADGLTARLGLGAVGGQVVEIVAGIRGLLGSAERYGQASRNAHAYVRTNHLPETVLSRVEEIFQELVARPGPKGAAGPERKRASSLGRAASR